MDAKLASGPHDLSREGHHEGHVIMTGQEVEDIMRQCGHIFFNIGDTMIKWHKQDLKSMISAQLEINNAILTKKLDSKDLISLKTALRKLTDGMKAHYTSTCYACGHILNSLEWHCDGIEHIKIEKSWGYNSLYDDETHHLVLCCNCYKSHIITGSLGKFVKREVAD